jgi:hypothetical protein
MIRIIPRFEKSERACPTVFSRLATVGGLLLLAGIVSGFLAVSSAKVARGSTFNWPSTPYQMDQPGNYAYRDMTVDWWGCSGDWCWSGTVGAWANIAATTGGYEYDSWGALIYGSLIGQITYSAGTYMVYANTPFWIYTPSTWYGDFEGTIGAFSGVCNGSGCLPATFGYQASFLEAHITGGTTGSCYERQYPVVYSC